jgi:hypothetical protein
VSNTQHVIRRLTFEIQIPSEEQGFSTQEMISDLFNSVLLRQLETLLDSMDSRHEVISIDKLEIDLGSITENVLEQEIPLKLGEQLTEKLQEVIMSARLSRAGEAKARSSEASVTIKPADKSKLDLLLHFLQTGTMPWWARNEEKHVSVLIVKLLEESPTQLRGALDQIFRNENYKKRFIYQLPDPLITEVLKLYNRSFSEFSANAVNDICTIHGRNSFTSLSSQALRLRCWSYFIQQALQGNTISRATQKAQHLRTLIKELQPEGDAILFVIKKARQMQDEQMLRTLDFADLLVIARKQIDDQKKNEGTNRKAKKNVKKKSYIKEEKNPEEAGTSEPGDHADEHTAPEAKESIEKDHAGPANDEAKKQEERELLLGQLKEAFSIEDKEAIEDVLADGIYINNAGLVIIWPYILPFFRKLELVKGNEFISQETRHRGVHILQYLASGNETAAEEHELILNKLLCGIDPGEPISAFTSLGPTERSECEQLLANIITNWNALKNISAESLRSTFFIKEGILQKDNGWRLRIERTAVDMLIDRLPWGISMIKLPWNEELIHVEW